MCIRQGGPEGLENLETTPLGASLPPLAEPRAGGLGGTEEWMDSVLSFLGLRLNTQVSSLAVPAALWPHAHQGRGCWLLL